MVQKKAPDECLLDSEIGGRFLPNRQFSSVSAVLGDCREDHFSIRKGRNRRRNVFDLARWVKNGDSNYPHIFGTFVLDQENGLASTLQIVERDEASF